MFQNKLLQTIMTLVSGKNPDKDLRLIMKLRMKNNSVHLRLTQGEVARSGLRNGLCAGEKNSRNRSSEKRFRSTSSFPQTFVKAFGREGIYKKLEKTFEKNQIEITTDFAVKEVTAEAVISDDNQLINYDMLMLLRPFRGQSMLGDLSFTDEPDFIEVDNFMRVQDLEKTYAVGDIAAFPGPKLAFMAIRQAQAAAESLAGELSGTLPAKFYYHDITAIIDEGGEDSIFLHYGVWDKTLYGLKMGRMWRRMKNEHNQLREVVRDYY